MRLIASSKIDPGTVLCSCACAAQAVQTHTNVQLICESYLIKASISLQPDQLTAHHIWGRWTEPATVHAVIGSPGCMQMKLLVTNYSSLGSQALDMCAMVLHFKGRFLLDIH